MHAKKTARVRRGKKTRMQIRKLDAVRLCVHRTPQHIYAQVLTEGGAKVIAAASSVEKSFREAEKMTKIEAAKKVGMLIAQRVKQKDVSKLAFDRSGFAYHGRVKALAEAAREGGLEF